MTTMKARIVTAFNQPLQIQEVEIPKISPGKVLVKLLPQAFAILICMLCMAIGQ